MKKKIFIRKNEKKNGGEIWKICYCPFCIVRRENCSTIQVLYCDWEGKARGQFVLQYNILYCDFGAAGY